MAKLILQNQTEPASPDAGCTTLYVDCDDGKIKAKDSNGCVNTISFDKSGPFDILAFGTGEDGCCHITCSMACSCDPTHTVFLCAKEYNFTDFIIDEGVTLRFCGNGVPMIKVQNCFCNQGTINARGTIVCPLSCSIFLLGSVHNNQNTGTLPSFTETDRDHCYSNGNGGDERTCGGNSYYGNGGDGGNFGSGCGSWNATKGGWSYYGNGGNGGSSWDYNKKGEGGCTYAGNGGNGGTDANGARAKGGNVYGGMYGLYIGADNFYNNCIYAHGGNAGCGGCSCGTSGGTILISYKNCFTCGTITVLGGCGCNNPVNGTLTINQIPASL